MIVYNHKRPVPPTKRAKIRKVIERMGFSVRDGLTPCEYHHDNGKARITQYESGMCVFYYQGAWRRTRYVGSLDDLNHFAEGIELDPILRHHKLQLLLPCPQPRKTMPTC